MNKITYNTRYSDTDKLDKFGRWARTASYNGIRIAWINKIDKEDKEYYSVSLHFPTLNNDTANEHKVFMSLQEAKEFVSERWKWFLNAVS